MQSCLFCLLTSCLVALARCLVNFERAWRIGVWGFKTMDRRSLSTGSHAYVWQSQSAQIQAKTCAGVCCAIGCHLENMEKERTSLEQRIVNNVLKSMQAILSIWVTKRIYSQLLFYACGGVYLVLLTNGCFNLHLNSSFC